MADDKQIQVTFKGQVASIVSEYTVPSLTAERKHLIERKRQQAEHAARIADPIRHRNKMQRRELRRLQRIMGALAMQRRNDYLSVRLSEERTWRERIEAESDRCLLCRLNRAIVRMFSR